MKLLKNILIIFVLAIFIASSIGVSFINHTCTSCKTSEIKLFTEHQHVCKTIEFENCCKTNNTKNIKSFAFPENSNNHINNKHNSKHNCCKDEIVFIKIKNLFIPSSYNFSFTSLFIFVNYFENFIINPINKLNSNFLEQSFALEKISSPTLYKISRFIL